MVDSVGSINWAINLDNDFRTNGGDVEDCKEVSNGVYKVTETDGDEYYVNNFGEITDFDDDPEMSLKTSSNSDKYTKLGEKLSEYQDKLSEAETDKETASLEKKISSVESQMDKLISNQQSKIDKLNEKLEKLQDKYSETEKESALESLDKKIEKVQEEIDEAESELAAMQGSSSSSDDTSTVTVASSDSTTTDSTVTSSATTTDTTTAASSTDAASSTTETSSTTSTTSTTETTSTDNTEKINELNEEKTANNTKITTLQAELEENVSVIEELDAQINKLAEEVKDDIAKANEEVAQIIKDKEEAFQKAVDDAVEEAKNQEVKDGEEPKSFSDILSSKMSTDLGVSGAVLTAMVSAIASSSKVAKIENYVSEMTSLNNRNIEINSEITTLTERNTAIDKELESLQTTTTTSSCCDPIGFVQGDNQFDFFIDKDSNGKLSDEKEFLGADKQWEEMTALDTDGDGKVTKDELSSGNVQMVKTDKEGNQSVVNIADVFGDSDFVDLSSYEAAEDGALYNNNEKQTLLGNFNVNLSGTDIEGYNTLDDVDWLKETYEFDDSEKTAASSSTNVFADTDKVAENIAQYTKDIESMNTIISETWSNLGIEEDAYNDFISAAKNAGKAESDREIANIKAQAEEDAKAKAAEETKTEESTTEETTTTDETEDATTKKLEETEA